MGGGQFDSKHLRRQMPTGSGGKWLQPDLASLNHSSHTSVRNIGYKSTLDLIP